MSSRSGLFIVLGAFGVGMLLSVLILNHTITKTKTRTIVCMVDNQQAIASCTRVKRK